MQQAYLTARDRNLICLQLTALKKVMKIFVTFTDDNK
jgi:hypothetical protein